MPRITVNKAKSYLLYTHLLMYYIETALDARPRASSTLPSTDYRSLVVALFMLDVRLCYLYCTRKPYSSCAYGLYCVHVQYPGFLAAMAALSIVYYV